MLNANSPTVQNMINSLSAGHGNMNIPIYYGNSPTVETGYVPSPQSTPYPTPKDMVMQAGQNPYGYYQPTMYPQNIPMPGYPQPFMNQNPMPMYGMSAPYVGMQTPYSPELRPMAPPPPGRYKDIQTPAEYSPKYRYRDNNISIPQFQPQYPMQQNSQPNPSSGFVGRVNYYDGQPVHPDVNKGFYGSSNIPYDPMDYNSPSVFNGYQNQAFNGYQNPYMNIGLQRQYNPVQYTPEMIHTANVAAFYGMSYDEYIENNNHMLKLMSRCVNKSLGMSDDAINQRAIAYDERFNESLQSLQPQRVYPMSTEDIFRECVDGKRVSASRKMHVMLERDGVIVFDSADRESKKDLIISKMSMAKRRDVIDNSLRYKDYRIARDNYGIMAMNKIYDNVIERQFDNVKGTPVEVFNKMMLPIKIDDLERTRRQQMNAGCGRVFSAPAYIAKLKRSEMLGIETQQQSYQPRQHSGFPSNSDTPEFKAMRTEIMDAMLKSNGEVLPNGKIVPKAGYGPSGNKLNLPEEEAVILSKSWQYDPVTKEMTLVAPDFKALEEARQKRLMENGIEHASVEERVNNFKYMIDNGG